MKFIVLGICSSICIGAIGVAVYATHFQKGVSTPKIVKQKINRSVRNRSVGHAYYSGGHRYGK